MFDNLIESGRSVEISYVYENETELDKTLCKILDFDEENKFLHIETKSGAEYLLPLATIRKIYIEGTSWQYHR